MRGPPTHLSAITIMIMATITAIPTRTITNIPIPRAAATIIVMTLIVMTLIVMTLIVMTLIAMTIIVMTLMLDIPTLTATPIHIRMNTVMNTVTRITPSGVML